MTLFEKGSPESAEGDAGPDVRKKPRLPLTHTVTEGNLRFCLMHSHTLQSLQKDQKPRQLVREPQVFK